MDNIDFEKLKKGIPKGTYERLAVKYKVSSNYVYKVASGTRDRVDILCELLKVSRRHKAKIEAILKEAEAL